MDANPRNCFPNNCYNEDNEVEKCAWAQNFKNISNDYSCTARSEVVARQDFKNLTALKVGTEAVMIANCHHDSVYSRDLCSNARYNN
jgi:hypothetical protein